MASVTTASVVARRTESLVVTPAIVAHRGASGYRPEHTLDAYRLAIAMGADDIEVDLVPTRDGVLVARHESELSGTTDIAERPEFADRQTTKVIDGSTLTGWFAHDLTLAELKTLTARERLPGIRRANTAYDGQAGIPTFNEILAMVQAESTRHGRTVGVMAELKQASYFDSVGLALDAPAALRPAAPRRRPRPLTDHRDVVRDRDPAPSRRSAAPAGPAADGSRGHARGRPRRRR